MRGSLTERITGVQATGTGPGAGRGGRRAGGRPAGDGTSLQAPSELPSPGEGRALSLQVLSQGFLDLS